MCELKLSHIPPKGIIKKNKIIKICQLDGCNNELKSYPSTKKYCSMKCYHKHRTKLNIFKCKRCNSEFKPNHKGRIFCSNKCFLDSIRVERYCNNNNCGKRITDTDSVKKYCSIKCYNSSRSRSFKIDKCQLEDCSKPLTKEQIRVSQKYCSRGCSTNDRLKKSKDLIGVKISLRKREEWDYPRRYIKTESGWVLLSRFLWEKQNGPIPKDHYIGYKDNNTFNDEDINNLYLIKSIFVK